jgi:hypothetical protein
MEIVEYSVWAAVVQQDYYTMSVAAVVEEEEVADANWLKE